MSYYPEPDTHVRGKVKVVLSLSNYATKQNQNMLQALIYLIQLLKRFIALKAEVDKLDIIKLTNVSTNLNNLKTKVNDLDVGKSKSVPADLKKLSDVVDNKVVKNMKFNTLETKVSSLENKIPDATTLIHINIQHR